MKIKQNESMFNDPLYVIKTRLSFSIYFLLDFTAHKVNLQNFYVNELTKWFVFEAVQSQFVFIMYKTLGYSLVSLYLIKHSCSFIKQYF